MMRLNLPHEIRIQRRLAADHLAKADKLPPGDARDDALAANLAKALEYESAPVGIRPAAKRGRK